MGKHRKQTFLHRHMHTERQHIELLLKGQTFKGYCCYLFVAPNVAPIIFARSCQYHTKSVWTLKSLRSGGGSFFTSADFGRMFYHSFPACAFFFFFFEVEISSHTFIPFFRPGSVHSGSASWDDWASVPWWDVYIISLFSDRLPHCAWTAA